MKNKLLKKALQFILFAVIFFILIASVHAQKRCKNGKCPPGYICGPAGYCVRNCPHCSPFLIKASNEIVSGESSQSAVIRFQLDETKAGSLKTYDVTGRLIRTLVDKRSNQRIHQFLWNVKDENENVVPTGIYILQLSAGNKL